MRMYTQTHACTHVCAHAHTHAHTHAYMHTRTRMHARTHAHTHACMHIHTHKNIRNETILKTRSTGWHTLGSTTHNYFINTEPIKVFKILLKQNDVLK